MIAGRGGQPTQTSRKGTGQMKSLTLGVVSAALVLMGGAAEAHHSGAMFDRTKTTTLEGTIYKFSYTQPHVWIEVAVPGQNGAAATIWSIEGGAPPAMNRQGVTPSVMKPGEKVVARMHPLKNGRTGGSFVDVTVGGKTYGGGDGGGREQVVAPGASPAAR
jgi:hypothetical protein